MNIKRLILLLLVTSNLVSGLAWAWDNHPGLLADGSGQVIVASLTDAAGQDATDEGALHDHYCCHGHAHLVALPFHISLTVFSPSTLPVPSWIEAPLSRHREVGAKPPRS
ncbi:MAG TPA: hypothetical protein ENK48_03540 [Gammaproteobacteria bacterium]|nr:hypothetical protein [Gammaproteobacteria bacterium]